MRVIGLSEDHVILEATKNEVGQLVGYYSRFNSFVNGLKHGTVINVHAMYHQLYNLSTQEGLRKQAREALTNMLQALEDVTPFEVKASSEGEPYVAP